MCANACLLLGPQTNAVRRVGCAMCSPRSRARRDAGLERAGLRGPRPSPRSASTNPDVDLLVVDDGSADATARVAAAAGVPVCRLPYNLGVGGAMRAGYRYAVRHDYDVVVQIDADGQHDPRYLPALVARGWPTGPTSSSASASPGRATRTRSPTRRFAMIVLARTLSRMARPGSPTSRAASGWSTGAARAVRRPLPRGVPRRHRRVDGHRAARGLHGRAGTRCRCGSGRAAGRARRRSVPRSTSAARSSRWRSRSCREWPETPRDRRCAPRPGMSRPR